MKLYISFLFVLFSFTVNAQVITVCSWNIQNFGQSKSNAEVNFIANTLKSFDIVVIQEVVAGEGGPAAISRLRDLLNKLGGKWDFSISHGTSSSKNGKERYAFMWRADKISRIGDTWLEKKYNLQIEREPYFARFGSSGKIFTIAGFHAIPQSKQPETEIKFFKFFPALYPQDNLIFCGDFNTPQSHTVFNPLKSMGYLPALQGQKTTLKQKCIDGNCLASEFDNFFYNTLKFKCIKSGVIPFYKKFTSVKDARYISDHLPVYFQFALL